MIKWWITGILLTKRYITQIFAPHVLCRVYHLLEQQSVPQDGSSYQN